MSNNKNLHSAKKEKNDEFYTQLSDIEKELKHYKEHFKDKIIYCNCDDPEQSNFYKYFQDNFDILGLKKLITSHYNPNGNSYKLEISRDINDKLNIQKTTLKGNGDFRSEECIELLRECDIVITNSPFSLFREYIAQLMEYDKKFLIIGNKNAITYKEIFKLIKENKLWIGHTPMSTDLLFDIPKETIKELLDNKKEGSSYKIINGIVKGRAQAIWFTNLDIQKRHEDLILYKKYSPEEFPKYDNYDAINVDKTKDIPIDYEEEMGVPITFLDKYNPEQFEILGQMVTTSIDEFNFGYPYVFGKKIYARIIIKKRQG